MDMSPLSPHTHAINIIKCEISISASDGNELIKKWDDKTKIAALKCPPKIQWLVIIFFSRSKLNRDDKKRVKDEGKKWCFIWSFDGSRYRRIIPLAYPDYEIDSGSTLMTIILDRPNGWKADISIFNISFSRFVICKSCAKYQIKLEIK